MKPTKYTAFTLVELIVVITILAVLATVAFISFQGYTSSSRDSVRLADLKNISKSFELIKTKNQKLPLPDRKIDITASGTIFQYQGVLEQNTLAKSGIHNGGLDPLSGNPYGYAINLSRNKFQLIGFLENSQTAGNTIFSQSFADNTDKFVKTSGDDIGILLDSTTNEIITQTDTLTQIDVKTNTISYGIVESGNQIQTPSVSTLNKMFDDKHNTIASCKAILDNGLSKGNGLYTINPNGISGEDFQVYCDMETDGGGWTLLSGNGHKFGRAFDINTQNPNFQNYNMSGSYQEKMIIDKGWKEYKYVLGYGQEDVTVYFNFSIDSERLSLKTDETPLCFMDKSINKDTSNIDHLPQDLAPYSWATYNGGKLLYPKRTNDQLRVRLFCEASDYTQYGHIKTIIGAYSSQHLTSDTYNLDGTRRIFDQFYISVDYLDNSVSVDDLPTFGNNLEWVERGALGSWHHYYLSNLGTDFSDGLQVEEINYHSPDWRGEANPEFTGYFMMR